MRSLQLFFGVFEADFMGSKISKTAEVVGVHNMSESAKPATTEMEGASVLVPEAESASAPSEAVIPKQSRVSAEEEQIRARQKSRTPANLSIALTRATALWQGLEVADALSHAGDVSTGSVFAPWSKLRSSTPDGGPLGPLSQSDLAGSTDTLGDTDFIVWALRVAPECNNLNFHTPVGTTLAIAFIMFSPERLISFQQAHSVMECCGRVEGPHEWSLTLSTTSRVPKPVYEALLGTLYADLVSKEGNDWKFGTGTRNVDRNEPHGFRF